jgi:hypothetical protein
VRSTVPTARGRDDALSAQLARRLAAHASRRPGARRLGLEHEYAVFAGTRQVDYRPLIARAPVSGARLHPTNQQLYYAPSGVAVMADGVVAEAASPPERLAPGFAGALERWGVHGRALLARTLPEGHALLGGSTHLSVQVDPTRHEALAREYARTFAPGLMLLMDHVDSPGLLVRPRPGRMELCGEHVDGPRLRAASAFAAGSVLALERGKGERRRWRREWPPALEVRTEAARQRFGLYVDRRAFGTDLYREGRRATLRRAGGGTISAQAQLEACWAVARDALAGHAAPADLADADRAVSGALALPSELRTLPVLPLTTAPPGASAFAQLRVLSRGAIALAPVAVTWDYVAYALRDGARSAIVSVPERDLECFVALVEAGELDDLLAASLAQAGARRALVSFAQTARAGFFSAIALSSAMVPPDRAGVGQGPPVQGRPGKVALVSGGQWPRIRAMVITAAAVAVVLALLVGALVLSGGSDAPPATSAASGVGTSTPLAAVVAATAQPTATTASATAVASTPQPTATPTATPTTVTATGVATAPSPPPPAATATTVVRANRPPVVAALRSTLATPTTYYTLVLQDPGGDAVRFSWFMGGPEQCGSPAVPWGPLDGGPATRVAVAAGQIGSEVAWRHQNAPSADSCGHAAPEHDVVVTVVARTPAHRVECSMTGSGTRDWTPAERCRTSAQP